MLTELKKGMYGCVCILYLQHVLHTCTFPWSTPANERVSISAHVLYVCTHTHTLIKHTAWPGQLGLDVNVQWSCEFLCELSQTHCIAPSLHMGPSCLLCTSQLQPLQATGGYFCSVLVVFNCNRFRTTAESEARLVCAVA